MKKLISIILVIVSLLACLTITAFADEKDDYIKETYTDFGNYISEQGWPNYVGGYYYFSTGYNPETPDIKPHSEIVIYITNEATEADKAFLESIITDFDVVSYKTCSHSRRYYYDLSEKLHKYENLTKHVYSFGVALSKDDVNFIMYVYENGYDEVMSILKANFSEYLDNIEVKVGKDFDLTSLTPESGYEEMFILATGVITPIKNEPNYLGFWILGVSLLVIVGGSVVFFTLRRQKRLITPNGTTISFKENSDVKAILKEENEPSEEVFNNIIKKIDENK